jgi:hypothetical protein
MARRVCALPISSVVAAVAGCLLMAAGPFTYLALVDETVLLSGHPNFQADNDGFDVNAVSIPAVPVPPALVLLGSALLGIGFLARRRGGRSGRRLS